MPETVVAVIPTSKLQNDMPGLNTVDGKSSTITIVGTNFNPGDDVTIVGSKVGGKAIQWTGKLPSPLPATFTGYMVQITVTASNPSHMGKDLGDTDDMTVTVGTSPPTAIPVNQGVGT
jgi:hypothetical protein